jgi:hypothetical protein
MAQDSNTVDLAEIRSQIERTRVEMSHTIDAIQDRLSPRRVMHEAKDTINEATIGRVKRLAHRVNTAMNANGSPRASAAIDMARRNPLVSAAVGALVLAAMMRSRPRIASSLGGLAIALATAIIAQRRTL